MTERTAAVPIDQESAVERAALGQRDRVRFWRAPRWDDLECLSAEFVRHAYAPHLHDTYAVGVIEAGAERFRYRGAEHIAPAGSWSRSRPTRCMTGGRGMSAIAIGCCIPRSR